MADARSFLPLKPVDLELLLALADGERHGYGLAQAIEAHTNGLLTLDPGNLYRVIKRLLAYGLVAEAGQRAAADEGGERRRYYRITPLGGRTAVARLWMRTIGGMISAAWREHRTGERAPRGGSAFRTSDVRYALRRL